ncbi:MAG: hypothetical protein P0Y59_06285 [Candidatus Sphingomonas phytovorans]|nr:hypothetical protein [Sphingomonas sp.]WEK01290.1 MAG: hypothetical protein P0Y59_06285 [Sphingomonas sp.]
MENVKTDGPTGGPDLTGEQLARAVAADFESFFLPWGPLEVRIAVEAAHSACIRRSGDETRIVIPPDMAREEIDSPDRLFFHLLILSHELAHLVHRHLYAGVQEAADYRALEYWADFYGAKVMMTLVTFGERVNKIFRVFFPATHFFEAALESVGRAVGRLVETVYTDDDRYPPKLLRVGLTSNGVTSFLRHDMINPPPIWYFSVFKRVFASQPVRELMLLYPEQMDLNVDPIERARKWHREMQGDKIAITPWFKPEVVIYLHTSFDQTDEERAASERMRLEELQAAGYLLNEPKPGGSEADARL